jgi:hypothetical protein
MLRALSSLHSQSPLRCIHQDSQTILSYTKRTMKLRYSAFSAAALASSSSVLVLLSMRSHAWNPTAIYSRRYTSSISPFMYPFGESVPSSLSFSSSCLQSTVAPEDISKTTTANALKPTGKSIAKGTVVSFFRGGLLAIQIDDDQTVMEKETTGDETAPKQQKTQKKDASSHGTFFLARRKKAQCAALRGQLCISTSTFF